MDKLSKKLLKISQRQVCSLCDEWDSHCTIHFSDLQKMLKADKDQILACVEYLAENGFVTYELIGKNQDFRAAYHLTHKGNNFKEFDKIEQVTRIKEYVTGAGVGAVFTLLVQQIIHAAGIG